MPSTKSPKAYSLRFSTTAWALPPGDSLIKVADEKVSAVHGGDPKDYTVMEMLPLFKATNDFLNRVSRSSLHDRPLRSLYRNRGLVPGWPGRQTPLIHTTGRLPPKACVATNWFPHCVLHLRCRHEWSEPLSDLPGRRRVPDYPTGISHPHRAQERIWHGVLRGAAWSGLCAVRESSR